MISRIITKVRLGFSYTEHTQTMETKINQKLFLYEKKRYTKTLYPSRTIRNLSISVDILKKKKKKKDRNRKKEIFQGPSLASLCLSPVPIKDGQ